MESFRWTNGRGSCWSNISHLQLLISGERPRDAKKVFVEIKVNGLPVVAREINSAHQMIEINIPDTIRKAGKLLEVTIDSDTFCPEEGDKRDLGIKLFEAYLY